MGSLYCDLCATPWRWSSELLIQRTIQIQHNYGNQDRALTNDKRSVVDFRLLHTRIHRRNTSIPLMSDALSILGNSKCEVVSCVDIKDAYHPIKLTEKSKEYCGILPYFGSPIYRYEVLPMGIACAPQICMDYITLIMAELEQKNKYIAIMDDLLLHSTKAAYWKL